MLRCVPANLARQGTHKSLQGEVVNATLKRPTRLGLIGCGRVARRIHLEVLTNLPHAKLVALADIDPKHLELAQRCAKDAVAFHNYHELIEQDLDAVVVCLPTNMHAECAVAALEQQKHVYVEKPLASDLAAAMTVLRAAGETTARGMIGFNFRFHPLYQALRDRIRSGELGRLAAVRTVFCGAQRELPAWKRTRETGGGALLDLASHHIDLIRFLFQAEITEVSACLQTVHSEDDTALIQGQVAEGPLVDMFVSMSAVEEDRVEVSGEKGRLVADRRRSRQLVYTPPKIAYATTDRLRAGVKAMREAVWRVTDTVRPPPEPSYRAALSHFVDVAQLGSTPQVTLLDGYRSLQVIAAAEKSARERSRVRIDYANPEFVDA